MNYLILLFAIVFSSSAFSANEVYLNVSGVSYHFDRDHKWNEINPGLGLTYSYSNELGLTAGFYKNSYFEQTVYAGVSYSPLWAKFEPVKFGVLVAAVTGYKYDVATVPTAQFSVSKNVSADVLFVPPTGADNAGFIALNFRYRLK